jgi:hypothetical protein
MNEIRKALNNAFDGCTTSGSEEFRARVLSALERCNELVSELERPRYRELVRFAVSWGELNRQLRELEQAIRERSTEKSVHPFDELFEQLTAKN